MRRLFFSSFVTGLVLVSCSFGAASDSTEAPPTPDENASSIGLSVSASTNLVFGAVKAHGGKAAPGADGVDPSPNVETGGKINGSNPTPPSHPSTCVTLSCSSFHTVPPAAGGTSTCAKGGAGGPGGGGGPGYINNMTAGCEPPGGPDLHGLPLTASATTSAGGAPSSTGQGADGEGAAGAKGSNGANGGHGQWSVSADGFVPGNGSAGTNGAPGGGGGGGGGAIDYLAGSCAEFISADKTFQTEPGAGGGAGGCAGLMGTAGIGGGASIGVLVVSSTVSFENAQISSSVGGRGGKGALGTLG